MGNKAENFINQISLRCSSDYCSKLFVSVRRPPEKSTPKRQGEFIAEVIGRLKADFGDGFAQTIMRPCGYCCISVSVLKTAKKLYRSSQGDIAEFLRQLNLAEIGGGKLRLENDTIICVYERCMCSVPNACPDIPAEYCECSAGWLEKLFSETTGREAVVTVRKTLLSGGDCCEFSVNLV